MDSIVDFLAQILFCFASEVVLFGIGDGFIVAISPGRLHAELDSSARSTEPGLSETKSEAAACHGWFTYTRGEKRYVGQLTAMVVGSDA